MLQHADVIIDLQAGDTGKGKVAHHLLKTNTYDAVLRFNGGGNAGHTVYHNGQKVVTHAVPMGMLYGIPSVIGPGCVVNFPKLVNELNMLRDLGFKDKVYIDRKAHVTLDKHIQEDTGDTKLGTTRQGIGPTYRDKYNRTGTRVEDVVKYNRAEDSYVVIDTFDMFYRDLHFPINTILCEGAQGFQLDIDWGDYPFVTSSHCTTGAVFLNAVAPRHLRRVFGIMKAYETYSGFKTFTNNTEDVELFDKIIELGGEYGATTGRKRQIRWLHLDELIKALYINNVTDLIINKADILQQINTFPVVYQGYKTVFTAFDEFKTFVENVITKEYKYSLFQITWSTSPESI
jgi:adenylosuccinate synthase